MGEGVLRRVKPAIRTKALQESAGDQLVGWRDAPGAAGSVETGEPQGALADGQRPSWPSRELAVGMELHSVLSGVRGPCRARQRQPPGQAVVIAQRDLRSGL